MTQGDCVGLIPSLAGENTAFSETHPFCSISSLWPMILKLCHSSPSNELNRMFMYVFIRCAGLLTRIQVSKC